MKVVGGRCLLDSDRRHIRLAGAPASHVRVDIRIRWRRCLFSSEARFSANAIAAVANGSWFSTGGKKVGLSCELEPTLHAADTLGLLSKPLLPFFGPSVDVSLYLGERNFVRFGRLNDMLEFCICSSLLCQRFNVKIDVAAR